jgi:hypothetical protein
VVKNTSAPDPAYRPTRNADSGHAKIPVDGHVGSISSSAQTTLAELVRMVPRAAGSSRVDGCTRYLGSRQDAGG